MSDEALKALQEEVASLKKEIRQIHGQSDSEWMDALVAESDAGTRTPGGLPSAVAQIPDVHDQEARRQQQDCARTLQGHNFPLANFDPTPDADGNRMLSNAAINAGIAVGAQLGINPDHAISRLQQASLLSTEQLNENLGGSPLVIPREPRWPTG